MFEWWRLRQAEPVNTPERNSPCPCGSGRKYKKCCMGKDTAARAMAPVAVAQQLQAARRHYMEGRLQEAERIYREILAHTPDQPKALHGLGLVAYRLGQHASALDFMTRASRQLPADHLLKNDTGLVQMSQGLFSDAVNSFIGALALKPDYFDAHGNLSIAYHKLGKLTESCASLERAIALRPGIPMLHFNLGNHLAELGRADEAIASYRRALELGPDDVRVLNNLATSLLKAARLDEAIEILQRAHDLMPDSAREMHNLGLAWLRRGEHSRGLELIMRAKGVIWFSPSGMRLLDGGSNAKD